MAVWQCTRNFHVQPKLFFLFFLFFFFCVVVESDRIETMHEHREHNISRVETYCSCTGGQRTIGYVWIGEVRKHKQRVARIVRALKKATILLSS